MENCFVNYYVATDVAVPVPGFIGSPVATRRIVESPFCLDVGDFVAIKPYDDCEELQWCTVSEDLGLITRELLEKLLPLMHRKEIYRAVKYIYTYAICDVARMEAALNKTTADADAAKQDAEVQSDDHI